MKRLFLFSTVALGLLHISVAEAEMCTQDVVPAATLLVPYFEVDLNSSNGKTTLVSVNNATPEPTLAHITMWTDWSQPTVDFDVFLTGYDVVTVNMRDVFNGNIPITADLQSDPGDDISPHGANPEWDGSFPTCDGFFPFFNNPVITGDNLTRILNGHTGLDVLGHGCMGSTQESGMAVGYMTIDSVNECSVDFPSDANYFGGLGAIANNKNNLWGDFFLVDPANNYAVGAPLAQIEASDSFDVASTATGYTFYGRYTQPIDGADAREPLASSWGFDYVDSVSLGASTEVIVWRDPTSWDTNTFYGCGEGPEWYPLTTRQVICFDDQENYVEVCPDGDCLVASTQRVEIGDGSFAPPYESGWCWIDLGLDDSGSRDVDFPEDSDSSLAQGWVGALQKVSGLYSGGLNAVQMSSACELPTAFVLSNVLFLDGFESGDLTAWSSAVP